MATADISALRSEYRSIRAKAVALENARREKAYADEARAWAPFTPNDFDVLLSGQIPTPTRRGFNGKIGEATPADYVETARYVLARIEELIAFAKGKTFDILR